MKQLILAGILLVYAAMFVNPNPDQEPEIKAEQITITSSVVLTTETADMSAYGLEEETNFEKISMKESLRFFNEKGSGILFYAKADGLESRLAAPVLNEAAKELGVHVYYIDCGENYDLADYNSLTPFINSTFVTSADGSSATFYLPDVIAVKNGEITGYHVSLVNGLILSGNETALSEADRIALKNAYIETLSTAKD